MDYFITPRTKKQCESANLRNEWCEILAEEKGRRNYIPFPCDIDNPNDVLTKLGLIDSFNGKESFEYITTGAPIWEYYLLRMYSEDAEYKTRIGNRYPQFIESIETGSPYNDDISTRRAIGRGDYASFIDTYKVIQNDTLKTQAKDFIDNLLSKTIQETQPIRQKNPLYLASRKKAARAFLKFLMSDSGAPDNISGKNLYDNLEKMLSYENQNLESKHMLGICTMLCLYGRKDEGIVSDKLKKLMEKGLLKKCDKTKSQYFINLVNETEEPPFARVYEERENTRVNVLFRLNIWLKLVNDTSLASYKG